MRGAVPKWLREQSAKLRCSGSTPLGASKQNLRDPVRGMSAELSNSVDESCAVLTLPLPFDEMMCATESLESNMEGITAEKIDGW